MKRIYCFVGPSGSGKTTILQRLFPKGALIKSFTTREPRPNEDPLDNPSYYFISHQEAQSIIDGEGYVQIAEYDGNHYGVEKWELENVLEEYDEVALACVYQSVQDYIDYAKDKDIQVIPIFVSISRGALERNFGTRTETQEKIDARLKLYSDEMLNGMAFDNVIDNSADDYGDSAVEQFHEIMKKY